MVASTLGGPYADDLALALGLAERADEVTMPRFRSGDLVVETKPDLTPVTEADRAVEREVRATLAERRPADAVLGEEYGVSGQARRRWVVDPIDGTKNYVRGVPVWATLVALLDGDDVVVGVVSAPALGRRWWAARGAGSWSTAPGSPTPRRLAVSAVTALGDASFSYSDDVGWDTRGAGPGLAELRARCWRTRGYGDFLSHVLVAEGAVDVAAEPELGPWDIAALVPVVEEAGGRLTAFDGGPALDRGCALTTNAILHPAALDLLRART
jgi:histidinol-phosphatase